jgi:hypothetical protein
MLDFRFIPVAIIISILRDVMACSAMKVNIRLEEKFCFRLQGRRVSQTINEHEVGSKLLRAWLYGYLSPLEEGKML